MDIRQPVTAILTSGYPTPGVNTAISACVIKAINGGQFVIGFFSGWEHLREGVSSKMQRLKNEHANFIKEMSGPYLKTSKSELENPLHVSNVIRVFKHHNVKNLICIGWPQTALSLINLESAAKCENYRLRTVLIPNSIFGDLPLPKNSATFGFSTARAFGSKLGKQYHRDAKANGCWYVINIMGSRSGHLCLAIGRNSGATLSIIPEQFEGQITFAQIVDTVECCYLKRLAIGKNHGLVLLSEGLANKMRPDEIENLFGSVEGGHSFLATEVCQELRARAGKRGSFCPKMTGGNIGFEIRCAESDTTDTDIARDLGYGAAHLVLNERISARVVAHTEHWLLHFPLDWFYSKEARKNCGVRMCDLTSSVPSKEPDLKHAENELSRADLTINPSNELPNPPKLQENIAWRGVDLGSLNYIVARKYMLCFKSEDMEDEAILRKMAEHAKMSIKEFSERYKYLVV